MPLRSLLPSLLLVACAAPSSSIESARVSDFAWLTGRWVGEARGMRIEQDWDEPRDGQMRGQHRAYRDGEIALLAPMRIVGYVDRIVLIGGPDGEPSRIYPLVECEDRRLVFQSPKPEFPARGEFERRRDQLTVTFRGDDGTGDTREVVYELRAGS